MCGVGRRARVAWTLASLSCCRCHWLASFLTRNSGRPPTPVSCHQTSGPHSQLSSPFSWKPCPFPLPPTWAKGSKWRNCTSLRRCSSPLLDLATTGSLLWDIGLGLHRHYSRDSILFSQITTVIRQPTFQVHQHELQCLALQRRSTLSALPGSG